LSVRCDGVVNRGTEDDEVRVELGEGRLSGEKRERESGEDDCYAGSFLLGM